MTLCRKTGVVLLGIGLLVAESGCTPAKEPSATHFDADNAIASGFQKAVRKGATVQKALELCNKLLEVAPDPAGLGRQFRLLDGWAPQIATNGGKTIDIPVFLIRSADSENPQPSLEWIRVPEGKVAVIIEEQGMEDSLDGPNAEGSSTTLKINPEEQLAVMLLHEVGHVANGDYGSFAEGLPLTFSSYNAIENISKSRELKADSFAANAISAGLKAKDGDYSRLVPAMSLSMCLSSWSFNRTKIRLLDNFGATQLHRPSVFWDRGNSHPNIELRILTMQHLLIKTDVSAALLDDFLNHRRKATTEPEVLWRRPTQE